MASDELRKFRLQRAKDFAERDRSNSGANISPEELAAITKKAVDLDAIQKSVSDAAAVGAPLWLSYIFLLFYVALAAGGVTHTQLLLECPVDLPFLNIKLPLKAFFILAPILFLIVHAYVLAHFAMLSDKAKAFHDRLAAKITAEVENDHAIREGLRQQLPINVFVQFLAGPTDIRESAFGVMLWVIAWTTLVGAPVAVLLLLQLQFLPYHDTRVTWLHRIVLCLDLAIIWWLWMKILADRDRSCPKHQSRWMKAWDDFLWFFRKFGAPIATAMVVIFSVLFATFPSEWDELPFRWAKWAEPNAATEFIFGKVDALNEDENKRISGNWPVNTLRLREFDIYAAQGVEGPGKLTWKPYSFSLKHRRLERADLRDAWFDNIDLRGARLDGALLNGTKLQKANLDDAQLKGATFYETQLQGASLDGTKLQGASLDRAKLQGASLIGAYLQGMSLQEARLQGASLGGSQLQGAYLVGAELQGVSFESANLQGALLGVAQLQGASLKDAQLQGASFFAAELQGADFTFAQLQAASLESAHLWRAWGELEFDSIQPIFLPNVTWAPESLRGPNGPTSWTKETYDELYKTIEAVPQGEPRKNALRRIARLDCKAKGDDLAPCAANAEPSPAAKKWRELLEAAQVDEATYAKALAPRLRELVCNSDANAIHILRGISKNWRLVATSREAPALIDDILKGNNCPVSSELTDTDKTRLREIKAEVLKDTSKPPDAAKAPQPSPVASPPVPPPKTPAKDTRGPPPRDRPPP
ncbi:pentapeptide repeat-containing protein [Methylocystis sp.]|uniref:pentapeptide repeat-containing protein n=1 Tax=Methylocystis sp. TaxID=1911079 RepID=UPI003D0D3915